ncbi:MAG: WD40 repeat domain-containing protein [Rhodovibrio sp.]|nr:WD40 repeat domain-containing protein [Rhodovibrio sp.]
MQMMHVAPISGVACSGGRLVATAGYDNQLILWDAASHAPVARGHHDHLANQCTFSPDGRFLASASSDYSARIWSLPDLRLRAVLTGHGDDVEMVAFDPQSSRLATCSRDHRLRIFDLNGRLLQICSGHMADVISVTWSPDGEELISSSDDGTVRKWRAADGSELSKFAFDDVETDTLVVTEAGVIIAGDDQGRITVIGTDGATQTVSAHDAGIKRLVYAAEPRTLVSLSYDRTMRTWRVDGQTLTPLVRADLPAQIWPRSCAFLSDRHIVFATFGSTYAVFDTRTHQWSMPGYQPSRSLNAVLETQDGLYTVGDSGVVQYNGQKMAEAGSLCNFLVPCGSRLLTGGQNGKIYDALSGAAVHQHRSPLNCGCTFEIDGVAHAAIGSYTGEFIVLKATAGGVEHVRTVPMHDNAIKGLASDGRTILGVSADCAVALMSIPDFAEVARWRQGHERIANACCVVDDGVYASVGRDLVLRVWDSDGVRHEVRAPHGNSLKCVAAQGRSILVGDYGGRLAVYDLDAQHWGDVVRPTTWGVSAVAAGRDGSFVASSYDGNIYRLQPTTQGGRISVALPVGTGVNSDPVAA